MLSVPISTKLKSTLWQTLIVATKRLLVWQLKANKTECRSISIASRMYSEAKVSVLSENLLTCYFNISQWRHWTTETEERTVMRFRVDLFSLHLYFKLLPLAWLHTVYTPCSPFLLAASLAVSLLRRVFFLSLSLEEASAGELLSGSGWTGGGGAGGGLLLSRDCLDEEFLLDLSSFLLLVEVVVVVLVVVAAAAAVVVVVVVVVLLTVVLLAEDWVVGAGDFRDDEDGDGAGDTEPASRVEVYGRTKRSNKTTYKHWL